MQHGMTAGACDACDAGRFISASIIQLVVVVDIAADVNRRAHMLLTRTDCVLLRLARADYCRRQLTTANVNQQFCYSPAVNLTLMFH